MRQPLSSLRRVCGAMLLTLAGLAAGAASADDAASPVGVWRVLDDDNSTPLALVRVYEEYGQFFGRIVKTFDNGREPLRCSACRNELRDQPLIGMVILRALHREEEHFAGGEILDPETGDTYRCIVHLRDHGQKLRVRGYRAIVWLGETRTWMREE